MTTSTEKVEMRSSGYPLPYVLLFETRSGSSYLTGVLAAHPDIRAWGEKFKTDSRNGGDQISRIRDFLRGSPDASQSPPSIVGFKTKHQDIVDPEGLASLLRELNARIICLTRRNRVKQAVSWFNAVRLHDRTGRWNLYQDKDRLTPFTIDPIEFAEKLRDVETARRTLLDYVTDIELPTLMIQYEEFLRNGQETIDMVFSFLGVTGKTPERTSLKNTSDDLRSVLDNLSELKEHLRGTSYVAMFDEILIPDGSSAAAREREIRKSDEAPSRSGLAHMTRTP